MQPFFRLSVFVLGKWPAEKRRCYRLKAESGNEVRPFRAWVPGNFGKERQGERAGYPDFFRCFQTDIAHGESAGFVEVRFPRGGAYFGCPVQTTQFERSGHGDVGRIRPLSILLYTVGSGKVHVPVYRHRTEVIPQPGFVQMGGVMRTVVEVSGSGVVLVIGNGYVETAGRVAQREVEFFGVVAVGIGLAEACRPPCFQ